MKRLLDAARCGLLVRNLRIWHILAFSSPVLDTVFLVRLTPLLKEKSQTALKCVSCVAVTLGLWLLPGRVLADSYNVNASVPYAVPGQAASFDPIAGGNVVQNSALNLSGNCQTVPPVSVVSVWSQHGLLGSDACDGTYQVQVQLQPGVNQITAKTTNLSNVEGPVSPTLIVEYVEPPVSVPQKPAEDMSRQETVALDKGAAVGLDVTASASFYNLSPEGDVVVNLTIKGGQPPYTIEINWGDGSVDTRTFEVAGGYDLTHRYRLADNYQAVVKLKDAQAAEAVVTVAITSPKSPETTAPVTTSSEGPPPSIIKQVQQRVEQYAAPAAAVAVTTAAAGTAAVVVTGQQAAVSSALHLSAVKSHLSWLRFWKW